MQAWQKVWREGIVPLLSRKHIEVLAKALEEDDRNLLQEATTVPPPLYCALDWPVEAACAIGYCGWKADKLSTVEEVENFFAQICYEIDFLLGEPAASRYFLLWYDEMPREEMRWALLKECKLALNQDSTLQDFIERGNG